MYTINEVIYKKQSSDKKIKNYISSIDKKKIKKQNKKIC